MRKLDRKLCIAIHVLRIHVAIYSLCQVEGVGGDGSVVDIG